MIEGNRQHIWTGRVVFAPPSLFLLLAVTLLVVVSWAAQAVFDNLALPFGLFVLTSAIALRGMVMHYSHRSLGMGNGVTLIRAALVAVLAGAVVAAQPATWAVFALACTAFALDGLDGWLARRSGLTSAFGARFDMEIDALLGAVLALILLTDGHVGPEILFLGFTRYAFVVASLFLPKLRAALPDSLRRKTICVIQIAALIALICPLTPLWLMAPLSWGAAGLLLWSFASDTRWLLGRP
ncbi:CDP-alcohol phosphatidyltransferase-like protein [Roseobacter litoralis Och 149]|uniref:CDP-alcohol phosphatidyltransferase-like protein n=1 Tax=Roseobacter litoralis (strain ATCC 49566 / DSM 6996 / JCM 21268 / NBRC 15278 / OCh 149) TaxID=391595 RepID=F7ZLR7_ROSLO|nr:CDP-alcohol phosphatidyltransferase-like protein [Roseobacter litoralis Och 149]